MILGGRLKQFSAPAKCQVGWSVSVMPGFTLAAYRYCYSRQFARKLARQVWAGSLLFGYSTIGGKLNFSWTA
jgi:hypothetical protein